MLKFGERVVFKCTTAKIIVLITILLINEHQVKAVSYVQGQQVTLHFPYPCDSTEVTLQHSYISPFYRFTDGSALSLPKDNRFQVQNIIENGNCSLNLTISNLMRSDEGTYLSTIYKEGLLRDEYTTRIWLEVDYPPGKASCVVSEEKGGDWVSIDCTAKVGSLPGKIECYQNGVWMPPLTDPTETDTTLKQKINITTNQPVLCCSSPLPRHIKRCECNDTALYLDDAVSSDPCPNISTKTSTTSTYRRTSDLVEKSQSSDSPLPSHTTSRNANKMTKSVLITSIFEYIGLAGVIIIVIWTTIALYQYEQERKNNSNDESPNLKAIIIFYISATGMVILIILFIISLYQSRQEHKNNSNDESQNLRTIFMTYIFVPGMVILLIFNLISFYHIDL